MKIMRNILLSPLLIFIALLLIVSNWLNAAEKLKQPQNKEEIISALKELQDQYRNQVKLRQLGKLAKTALEQFPTDEAVLPEAYLSLGLVKDATGEKKWDEAIDYYNKVLKDFPKSETAADASYRLAKTYWYGFGGARNEESKKLFIDTLKIYPKGRRTSETVEYFFKLHYTNNVEDGLKQCTILLSDGQDNTYYDDIWRKRIDILEELRDFPATIALKDEILKIKDETIREEILSKYIELLAFFATKGGDVLKTAKTITGELSKDETLQQPLAALTAFYMIIEEKELGNKYEAKLNDIGRQFYQSAMYRLVIRKYCEEDRMKGEGRRRGWNDVKNELSKRFPLYKPDPALLIWVSGFYDKNEPWGYVAFKPDVLNDLIECDPKSPVVARYRLELTAGMRHVEKDTKKTESEKQFLGIIADFPDTREETEAREHLVHIYISRGDMDLGKEMNLKMLAQGTALALERYKENIELFLKPSRDFADVNTVDFYSRAKRVLAKSEFLSNAGKNRFMGDLRQYHIVESPRKTIQRMQEYFKKNDNERLYQEALILEGQMLLYKERYADALPAIENALTVPLSSENKIAANKCLAINNYFLRKYSDASSLLEQIELDLDDNGTAESIYYKALIDYYQDNLQDCQAKLNMLIQQKSSSDYGTKARRFMEYIEPLIKAQQGE